MPANRPASDQIAECALVWLEKRWCIGVGAGEQGPDGRLVPSVLEESCAQLDGPSAELGSTDATPPEGRGVGVPAFLGPVEHVQRLSARQQVRVCPGAGMDAEWDVASVHEGDAGVQGFSGEVFVGVALRPQGALLAVPRDPESSVPVVGYGAGPDPAVLRSRALDDFFPEPVSLSPALPHAGYLHRYVIEPGQAGGESADDLPFSPRRR